MARYGKFRYNSKRYNAGGPDVAFEAEQNKKLGTRPRVKVEFVSVLGQVTDITEYYLSGGILERLKERAPDEIQAGDFDIVLSNHDDNFSEFVAGSLFEALQYHGAKIKLYFGFDLGDGSVIDWRLLQVGLIDELIAGETESIVTLRCRDSIRRLLDSTLRPNVSAEIPVPGGGNVGDGTCTSVSTKPFKTVTEDWTLTCTTPGADGVAIFSVVGSVSGALASATSGTEFSTANGAGGIKFTLTAGATPWSAGDTFAFSTKQAPQWASENPIKIIWAVLTGYNWDTDTAEPWADAVMNFDHAQSGVNEDLDYDTFAEASAQFGASEFITGYVAYNEDAAEFLQGILIQFLGSLYTGNDGRIRVQSFQPTFASTQRNYADTKKVTNLGYRRAISEVINQVIVRFKKTNTWEFSDEEVVLNGLFTIEDAESIAKYNALAFEWDARWYSAAGNHVEDFADRLVTKYSEPPIVIDFETGMDGILAEIGDHVTVTDAKYGLNDLACEISRVTKVLDGSPMKVGITVRTDGTSLDYAYLGSRVDEGDGISPQASTFGTASDEDKRFCYLTNGYGMF